MAKNNNLKTIKPKIIHLLKMNGIRKAGIFGSYARGEEKRNSDIDILIEIPKNKKFSLLDFVGLKQDLEDSTGKKIDLVEYAVIKPRLQEDILKEEVRIL